MGRRENPIGACGKALQILASWLRARRQEAGLTFEQLAARTDYSADTLSRAASGSKVPKRLPVVRAFAEACGADPDEAERLWKRARYEERHLRTDSANSYTPHVDYVTNFAELHAAMLDLYHKEGTLPYRELDRRAGAKGLLPHTTIGRVLHRDAIPSLEFTIAFAWACGVRGTALGAWRRAWDRADDQRQLVRYSSRARFRASTAEDPSRRCKGCTGVGVGGPGSFCLSCLRFERTMRQLNHPGHPPKGR
ncbi:helix-turn-helix domain-containing protein [Streptomyces sp. NPDC058947]|uniref:helix-turn-helix domain-containing protein n=1 Tax=Streptomyces sp. NPDC058947 TaxID=3346675 RepID=UPI0036908086